MKWQTLLSSERMRDGVVKTNGKSMDLRSEFEKDYHRIIGSASFRRLQDKTQVFPLDKSDFIRTRLTHSLEVSSFARSLGQNIGESILQSKSGAGFTYQMKEDMTSILQCAGLIHDIGNPPFGHFGELSIREWFIDSMPRLEFFGKSIEEQLSSQMREDFYRFEGNAQALRLVTKLHYLVDEYGMNLTYALLNTIVKYPVASTKVDAKSGNIKDKKMGYYFADEAIFTEITSKTTAGENRHPLTFILEAADDLAYKTADIEDGFIKGFISYPDLVRELEAFQKKHQIPFFSPLEKLQSLYERGCEKKEKYPETYAVKNWIIRVQAFLIRCVTEGFMQHYDEIMNGTCSHDLYYATHGQALMDFLGDVAYRYVFSSQAIFKMEVSEQVILDFLLEKLVNAVLYYDTDVQVNSLNKRVMSFFSDNYVRAYQHHAKGKSECEKLYLRLLLVTDFICGMTDSYAKGLYQELRGIV
ncbi:MAG: deoxyguanosinetriphosphate triphosphohydrolase [Lachnospiraceae bacterium]|nr:deoxyguanosinetriphosphate triphosphohydrolase [Lachnospiraceae bacterium]